MKRSLQEQLKEYIEDCKWTINNLKKELEYWKAIDNKFKVIEYETSIADTQNEIEVLTDMLNNSL